MSIRVDFTVDSLPQAPLTIGVQGEHHTRSFVIDLNNWPSLYPDAVVRLEARRPGEKTVYEAEANVYDYAYLIWNITDYDTNKAGFGSFQIILNNEDGTNIAKTPIVRTYIYPSQAGAVLPDPPEPAPAWADALIAAASVPVVNVDESEITGFDPVEFQFTEAHREMINAAKFGIAMINPYTGNKVYYYKTLEAGGEWTFFSFFHNNNYPSMDIVTYDPETGHAEVTVIN